MRDVGLSDPSWLANPQRETMPSHSSEHIHPLGLSLNPALPSSMPVRMQDCSSKSLRCGDVFHSAIL